MDSGLLSQGKKVVVPTEPHFEHLLRFSERTEEKNPKGKLEAITLLREIKVVYLESDYALHRYQIFCHQVEFELERKTFPGANLKAAFLYLFDEVVVNVNDNGCIVHILNMPFLRYRWSVLKEELIHDYGASEVFLKTLRPWDEMIADHDKTIVYLISPSMYGLYFNGYWQQEKRQEANSRHVTREGQDIEEEIDCKITDKTGSKVVQLFVRESLVKKKSMDVTKPLSSFASVSMENEAEQIVSKGEYVYLDNVLHHCRKEIVSGSKKTIYTAKWVGLKKVLPPLQ